MLEPADRDTASDLIQFINASPTPYHAVVEVKRRLVAAGFSELDEREAWPITPGAKHFVVRGGGTLVAFVAGGEPPSHAGFLLLGAHTDSPNLRVKPSPDLSPAGYRQFGVEVYGGVIWHTWLDRDLSVAGRLTLQSGETRLVRFDEALCRIPSVAIHLNRDVNSAGLQLNAQNHLVPLLGLGDKDEKRGLSASLSERAQLESAEIVGLDLCLFDVQPACIGGERGELLFAPRLDNLASCHAATTALLASGPAGAATRVIALYDHEEVGSQSAAGAKSRFLSSVLDRVASAYADAGRDATSRAFARSLMVSADMAHAVHPNYSDKHDKQHAPQLGKGPVIKANANQSYATDGPSAAVFEIACRETGTLVQRFVSRNDMPCGSTIGPISAAAMGVRTVDVGNPMLSMHSCREMAATADVAPMIRALTQVFQNAKLPKPSA
ncbi:MAG: M18 family aminopeptidase [Myxococcales bacterium]|nr:M18 family aminopeptidase [Myxococcales bacterium]